MSDSLDPDQARRLVGPDLGPNCLPRLSADDTGRQGVISPFSAPWTQGLNLFRKFTISLTENWYRMAQTIHA